jgi:hypothetical protein
MTISADTMMENAIQQARAVRRAERLAFDEKYGDFLKCVLCGAAEWPSPLDDREGHSCRHCGGELREHGYAPPLVP